MLHAKFQGHMTSGSVKKILKVFTIYGHGGHKIALQYNQREITPIISKAELWFLCMTHRLIVLYNCMKFHFYSLNGCQLTERTRNSIANDQREITPKISKAELRFLCMTHRLIVLYNCMKFHLNNFNCCQLTERTRKSIANDQREITPKISKAMLWFLCMTRRLNVLYKCMKFR